MKKNTYRIAFIFLLAFVSLLVGCSVNNITDTNVPAVTVNWKKNVTVDDISRIKWLEGTWRGTGEGQEPFYERYSFNGTVLTEESFADASLTTVKDSARYALVNGEFRYTTTDARRVAASEITDDHIQFVPVVGGGNAYRFELLSEGKWRAVLDWPATADKPAKQVIYNMESYKK